MPDYPVPPLPNTQKPAVPETLDAGPTAEELAKLRAEEDKLKAVQDAALNSVREACDRERALLREKEHAT
jgi:hypothetical protein